MTLRDQILTSVETLGDLVWAAEQRFREAEELLVTQHEAGAVYMFGISAEIWLKLSCFKFVGASPATPIDSLLGPARVWMKSRAPSIDREGYHSLLFWVEYLLRRRQEEGKALATELAGKLRHHVVSRLFLDWKIDLRYRRFLITERNAWRVYNDTAWLRQNWDMLWR